MGGIFLHVFLCDPHFSSQWVRCSSLKRRSMREAGTQRSKCCVCVSDMLKMSDCFPLSGRKVSADILQNPVMNVLYSIPDPVSISAGSTGSTMLDPRHENIWLKIKDMEVKLKNNQLNNWVFHSSLEENVFILFIVVFNGSEWLSLTWINRVHQCKGNVHKTGFTAGFVNCSVDDLQGDGFMSHHTGVRSAAGPFLCCNG